MDRVDRTPPSLTTRESPTTVTDLGGGRYGAFITSRHLRASDRDSPAEEVEFSISRPPRFGHLENVLTGELAQFSCSSLDCSGPISGSLPPGAYIRGRFTQRDLDRRAVVFVIPADVEATADDFQFRLTDPAGNSAPPDTCVCSWSDCRSQNS